MNELPAALPPGFRFHGLCAKPEETLFMRRTTTGDPEFLFVSYDQALVQPLAILADDSDEQQAILEMVKFEKARRERRAQP